MPDEDINSAVASAVSEASTETAAEPEEAAPEAAEPEAAPEPEAAAPEKEPEKEPETPPEEEEEFWNPTAEELALIDKNPELKKVYRSMVKGFTTKTQKLSGERKILQERAKIADWVQANPADAARILAAATGMTIAEAKAEIKETKEAIDELESEWAATVGPEAAKLLRPLFEKTAEKVLERNVMPLQQKTQELEREAQARGIAASIREFGAAITTRGDEWDDDIQSEMAELSKVIEPGQNTTIDQYLDTLYDKVWAQRTRAKSARSNLDRLRRIKNEQEPTTSVRPTGKKESVITSDMSEKDAIALAVQMAREERGRR